MRILYDGIIYSLQKAGGINRYFASIISHLPETCKPTILVDEQQELNYPNHPNQAIRCVKRSLFRFKPHRVSNWSNEIYENGIGTLEYGVSASRRYDVMHPTYYRLLLQRGAGKVKLPIVLTVYDMINELLPEMTDPAGYAAADKRQAILAAQAIICISNSTKRDLLERYDIPEDRVHVTHLASDIDQSHSMGPEAVPGRPYFLYVGSRAAYKNFAGLVSAFQQVLCTYPDTALCVVGLPFTEAENKELAEQKVAHRIEHYGQIDDAHLAKLYRCSVGFVYPSFYEGFGIPPLEAMACGTVAIAANNSSLPEVVGDAGILFDPHSDNDLADVMISLLSSPVQRGGYIKKGLARAQEFSWDKTAAQTVDVYRSVC